MAIKFRPETIAKIKPCLIQAIEETTVNGGVFVGMLRSFPTLWKIDELLPEKGPVRDQIDLILGDHPFPGFVVDYLTARLNEAGREIDPSAQTMSISKALDGIDPSELANDIIAAVESLPWTYEVTLRLPKGLANFVQNLPEGYDFGPKIRIVRGGEGPRQPAQPLHENWLGKLGVLAAYMAAVDNAGRPWGPDEIGLQVQIEGFISRAGRSEGLDDAHGLLKAFFGLALAFEALEPSFRPKAPPERFALEVHRVSDGHPAWLTQRTLGELETAAIYGLEPIKLKGDQRGRLGKAGQQILGDLAEILSAPDKHSLLLRACRWLFDSYVSDDPLLSFVQATVVLEILLGDKATSDEVGLGTLLANRCAYMVGRSTTDREHTIKLFREIYAVRSKIVHSGKHRLSSHERTQLQILYHLCHRVITAEAKLALAASRRVQAS